MLLNGQADVSLVPLPASDSRIAAIHLTHDSVLAVLPENHALRDHVTIHLADLRNEQIIGSNISFRKP
jgi:DNA-binding transcriptional LysR family regulator